MKKELSIKKFTQKHMKTRLEPATGEGTLCGTILSLDAVVKKLKDLNK